MSNEKQLIQLPPNDLLPLEQVSLRYDAVVHQGVNPEDVLVPGFWAHHGIKLRPFDELRIRAHDGTWVGYYLVLDCSRTWAKVELLSMHRLTTADVALTQASETDVEAFKGQHEVKHRGPHKWSIVRKADGAVLEQGIAVKDDALTWLDTHARQQVGGAAKKKSEPVAA